MNSVRSISAVRRVNQLLNRIDVILDGLNGKTMNLLHAPRAKKRIRAIVTVSFILYTTLLGKVLVFRKIFLHFQDTFMILVWVCFGSFWTFWGSVYIFFEHFRRFYQKNRHNVWFQHFWNVENLSNFLNIENMSNFQNVENMSKFQNDEFKSL